jgi:hypothetical protein
VAAQACELADGIGEMGFANAAGTEKDAVGFVANEVECGDSGDDIPVDGLGVVEVVGIEGGEREDGGALQGGPSVTFELHAQLLAHQMVEERGGRVVARDGFLRG